MERDDIIATLNDLVETCKDGEYGFLSCAEHVRSPELRQVFANRATDCRSGARELQALVQSYGGQAEDEGSVSGAVHRGWVAVKGTLVGYSDLAMLEECERGEDVALARYRKALEKALPEPVRETVLKQLRGVELNHNQIRDLRDRMRREA